jgi:uncharacterized protein DUF4336
MMVTKINDGIWTVDGPNVVFAGASMHTRMTVVRLQGGGLWVHSPIELNEYTQAFLKDIGGEVVVLIAPNKFHYLFIEPWREAFPDAKVFAEEHLLRKAPSLAYAEVLTNSAPSLYSQDVDQVIFAGSRMFQEVVFFHKASRSLIFTDLMINLKTDEIKPLPRLFLEFEGVTYPNGGIPRLYRWFSNDKNKSREALKVIRNWEPQRVLFCHGEPFDLTAEEVINREFEYLS